MVTCVGVVGDIHGHLQLALAVMARWQQENGKQLEAVFLCGDVGTFTHDSPIDKATVRHAQMNPIELEFLTQWSTEPPAPWLKHIFNPIESNGLGLTCPVVMVHGNHEGFNRLESLIPHHIPHNVINVDELPRVDTSGHIYYLPSGWRTRLPSGCTIAGVGGIEAEHRKGKYHKLAYFDHPRNEAGIQSLMHDNQRFDLFITHQGSAQFQGSNHGSELLDILVERDLCRAWFHGHSIKKPEIAWAGPDNTTQIVPLKDIAFPTTGNETKKEGWAWVTLDKDTIIVERTPPIWLSDFNRNRWYITKEGMYVCPDLQRFSHE